MSSEESAPMMAAVAEAVAPPADPPSSPSAADGAPAAGGGAARRERQKLRKTSTFRGVAATENGTWRARIRWGKYTVHLGRFREERDAAQAYDRAASLLLGPSAVLNFGRDAAAAAAAGGGDERRMAHTAIMVQQALGGDTPPAVLELTRAASWRSLCSDAAAAPPGPRSPPQQSPPPQPQQSPPPQPQQSPPPQQPHQLCGALRPPGSAPPQGGGAPMLLEHILADPSAATNASCATTTPAAAAPPAPAAAPVAAAPPMAGGAHACGRRAEFAAAMGQVGRMLQDDPGLLSEYLSAECGGAAGSECGAASGGSSGSSPASTPRASSGGGGGGAAGNAHMAAAVVAAAVAAAAAAGRAKRGRDAAAPDCESPVQRRRAARAERPPTHPFLDPSLDPCQAARPLHPCRAGLPRLPKLLGGPHFRGRQRAPRGSDRFEVIPIAAAAPRRPLKPLHGAPSRRRGAAPAKQGTRRD
ncbi:MAG: hypothetical protein J3K34DRAFT_459308 [Monoraphidium minutum]|nr:MAG: hypothetical protein J3K34DRAFT_459308 [Monoraphidium minutum]